MKCCGKLEFTGGIDETKLREALRCSDIFEDAKLTNLDITRLLKAINTPSDPY
jgi:hypothetical protein